MAKYLVKDGDDYLYSFTTSLANRSDMKLATQEQIDAYFGKLNKKPEPEVKADPVPVEEEKAEVVEEAADVEDIALEDEPEAIEAESSEEPEPEEVLYENMHWRQLKKLVIDAGGEWINKEEAIAFLRAN